MTFLSSAGAARSDREVALAQRGEQIGQRLQRQHHALAHAERAAGPDADDEDRQRPLNFRGVVAGPQQNEGDDRRGETGGQRQQETPLIEPQARVWLAGGRIERGEERVFGQFRIRNLEFRIRDEFQIPNSQFLILQAVALEPSI